MNIKKIIQNFIENVKKFIENLSYKQKLIYSIVFVAVIFIIVKLVFENIIENRNSVIDYKNMNGEDFYILSHELDNDDLYVILKNISDDIIEMCLQKKVDNTGQYITSKKLYNEILTSNYEKNISMKEFSLVVESIVNKYNNIADSYIDVVPSNITEYYDGYYIVTYNSNQESIYIGIMLDVSNNRFYIWYLE